MDEENMWVQRRWSKKKIVDSTLWTQSSYVFNIDFNNIVLLLTDPPSDLSPGGIPVNILWAFFLPFIHVTFLTETNFIIFN